jgi:EAL domain-containing protein (putative c-di-GMP-specific phosphodiesterase class I)/PAS domain-containing protein
MEQLEATLQAGAPDMVLCADSVREAKAADVTEICIQTFPELPVIWLSEQPRAELLSVALGRGAADVCSTTSPADLKHFERVFVREIAAVARRRELNELRNRVAAAENLSQQLLLANPEALIYVQEGIVTRANPAFAQLVGVEKAEDITGHPLMDYIFADNRTAVRQHLKHVTLGQLEGEQVTFAIVGKENKKVEVRSRWKRTTLDGEPAIELTMRSDAPAEAKPGTAAAAAGGPGRITFLKGLASERAQNMQRYFVFLAVDGFSSMEERLGLQSAEEAVLELIEFLGRRLAGARVLCRFSTDEIASMLDCPPDFDVEGLIASLCRDVAAEVFHTSFHEAHLTVTALAFPLGQENADSALHDLVREARKQSKQGGNKSAVLGPVAKTNLAERELARRAAQVKQALEHNQLRLAYQSIASLEGDTRQHQDVLVRMIDNEGQETVAADFIAAAEKHGLIRQVDRWVVTQILQLIGERKNVTEAPSMFVRISEETLRHGDEFLAWIRTKLQARALKPEELVFELPEAVLQNHVTKGKEFCEVLRKVGIEVCIGYFGASPQAERLLETFPARYVKFHPQFTQRFGDPAIQKRLNALLGAVKPRNIKTICSHIEDANQMAKLWQLGINFIQGRRIQEPEVLRLS